MLAVLSLWMLAALAGCTPVRPVDKVGLIAPFEGLYRETGYAALDALRQAIVECSPPGVSVIPLALDDSSQPQTAARAAQKMLTDPTVVAIVGPFSLDTIAAVAEPLAGQTPLWIVPTAIDASGNFALPDAGPEWLAGLILKVATAAHRAGATSLAVAGLPAEWESTVRASVEQVPAQIPVTVLGGEQVPGQFESGSALLWLGQPHQAAQIAAQLNEAQPGAAFWMGPQGDDPVFLAHTTSGGPRYWVTWVTPQYNSDAQQAPGAFTVSLTYAATCRALAETYDQTGAGTWPLRVQAFELDEQGISHPLGEP